MKNIIEALAEVVGFDIELNLYRSAGSFESALPLFFDRLLGKLKATNNNYVKFKTVADVVPLRSKQEIKTDITKYIKKIYDDTLLTYIQQYIEIVKMYKQPKTDEKNRILVKTMKEFLAKLDKEFLLISETATDFLILAKKYNLNQQPTFASKFEKLEFLSELATSDFIKLLKEGDINKLT